MTRWFYDTEFSEDGRTIDLISIALVHENGHFYYAVSTEFSEANCSDWVKGNVLPHLPDRGTHFWKTRATIASDIRSILLDGGDKPELWAYFGDYDHVALCQLYGRMVDLPTGFPFYTLDLKQLMQTHGIVKEQLPKQSGEEHDALADARWVRDAYRWIEQWRMRVKTLLLTISLLTSACSSELCGRVEGPELALDAEGSTGCWAYTGEPRCYPTLANETPCDARREVFHWGDRLTLWCDADVVAPKAVMVPVGCE